MRKIVFMLLPLLLLSSCQYDGIGSKMDGVTFGKEPYWLILTGSAKAMGNEGGDTTVWFKWSEVSVYYKNEDYPFDLDEARKDDSLQTWRCPKVWLEGKKPVVPTK